MNYFVFKGFEPAEAVRFKANRVYDRIADAAPSDAHVTAQLEWDGEQYHCSIEVGSGTWPAAVSAAHRIPGIALDKAEIALLKKLNAWREARFTPLRGESRELAEDTIA